MKKIIYLDYAAATPLDRDVFNSMIPYFSDNFFNPSSTNSKSRLVKEELNQAKQDVASLLGARKNEVIFVSGGSEANNLAIKGVLDQYPGSNILVSSIEHDSVWVPANKYKNKVIKVDNKGQLDIEDLAKKIDDKTVLISVIYASNEIGVINKLNKIAELIKKIRQERIKNNNNLPLLLHSDASAAANYLSLNVNRLGVDLMTINGSKIYGPKSIAALYVRAGIKLIPLIYGGGQESGLRSGTENVASIIGFKEALVKANNLRKVEEKRVLDNTNYLIDRLTKNPKIKLNGPIKNRIAGNINISINGVDNETLMYKLDDKGIIVSTGSACSAASIEPSRVLASIGLDEKVIRESIRITLGRHTTKKELDVFLRTLEELIK